MAIAQKDFNMLSFYPPSRYPLEPNGINVVNLMWYWYSICNVEDELVNRKKYKSAFEEYGINPSLKKQLAEVSQFASINKLFSMEYRDFLELKRSFREEINSLKNELCPIGTIQTFAFNTVPEGWLVCDGELLSINLFPELYSVIGTVFGGNGESNFALPDLRGRFIRGWNAGGENDPERTFGSTQEDTMQVHQHHFDPATLSISKGGGHYHSLWCHESDTVVNVSRLVYSEKSKRMCYPQNKFELGMTDIGPYAGQHNHDLTMSMNPVLSPKSMTSEKIRVSSENRPKNIALLFCIRCK
jgi:microcystin-dependent protein